MWRTPIDLAQLNANARGTLLHSLGIQLTAFDDQSLSGTMPVDDRTHQPFGILHGGASVALAETLGSIGGNHCVAPGSMVVGLDINANHLRPAMSGVVIGVARPIHLGSRTQVWEIKICNDAEQLVCVSRLTLAVVPRLPLKAKAKA